MSAVSGAPPVGAAFAVLAAYGPVALLRGRARRRQRERAELWPDVVDDLASGVRAGMSLPDALTRVGERGPAALREAFVAFGTEYQATGRFGACLDHLKAALGRPRRRSRRRGAAGGARGRRRRPGAVAARAVGIPARRPAYAGRARVAAVVDRQRRPTRRGGAVGGAVPDVGAARRRGSLRQRRWQRGAARRRPGVRRRVPADGAHRAGCRWSSGCSREPRRWRADCSASSREPACCWCCWGCRSAGARGSTTECCPYLRDLLPDGVAAVRARPPAGQA